MTLLQDRPELEAAEAARPPAPAREKESWFDTSDHKRLGLLFIYTALLFVVAAAVVGLFVGAKDISPGLLSSAAYLRLYGFHTQATVLLFLTAIWIGIATYVVPLQIGAGRLALPRLLATGYWTYFVGGGIFVASFLVGEVDGTTVASKPIAAVGGTANDATKLWIVGLALISVGFLFAAASLFTTVLTQRSEGMTILRVPAFSWATLVSASITLVATPVFLGGLLLFGIDQHFGGTLFSLATPGSLSIWQHTVWLYGRPDVYLLTLVGLGAATDIITTHARRPLLNHTAGLGLIGLFGALTLTTFTAGDSVTNAVIVPTYTAAVTLVVIPLGALVLLWLGTSALGRPRVHVSLLFVVGALGLWLLGGGNAIAATVRGVKGFDGASTWVAGNAHAVVFGPPTLLAVGALYHWAPKIWGRRLHASAGALAALLLFAGFAAAGMGYYLLGYNGVALGMTGDLTSYQKGLYGLAEGGGAAIGLAVLIVVADMIVTILRRSGPMAGDDPYEGLTLEWATSSPPPRWGFDQVPEVRSEAPLAYLREAERLPAGGEGDPVGGATAISARSGG